MKFIAILGAICALSQSAAAQTGECRSVASPAERLACYDKAAPVAGNAPAARPPAAAQAPGSTAANGNYVDQIAAEDAVVNAKLRNICRGC